MTIADVGRCLREVGMTWGDLLDVEVEPTAKADGDDVATLASLLVAAGKATTADRLARALRWSLGRLVAAATGLDDHLRPLGLRLQRNANGYLVRPLDARADDALTRLNQIRDDEDGLHAGMARVLHQALDGSLSRRESKNDQAINIAPLLNRGAIEVSAASNEHYVLSDDVRFCLDF